MSGSTHAGKKILIVDDDADLLEMIDLVVASAGYNPVTAPSGGAAMTTVAAGHFDLILMDVFLGDADGREIAQTLKRSPDHGHIPILLYSAGADINSASIQRSLADGFISKPFDVNILLDRIKALL